MDKIFEKQILEKVLPKSYTLNTADKPMHSGEVYFLWEALTAGYQMVTILEMYQMNTKDKELHALMQGIVKGLYMTRITKLEKFLKDAGFTVPPRPASKTKQGKPGVGQEVKLSDEEVLKVIFKLFEVQLDLDGRAIGSVTTSEKIREVFIGFLNADLNSFDTIQKFADSRQAVSYPPKATASVNGLTIAEAYWLWHELNYRYSGIIMLESFISNTNDQELIQVLSLGLNKVSYPQMNQLETLLKTEGFTVPSRPVDRMKQQPKDKVSQIVLRDNEIISLIVTAAQKAINTHIRAYTASKRSDVKKTFKSFIYTEIDSLKKMIKLASKRNILEEPPRVTSRQA